MNKLYRYTFALSGGEWATVVAADMNGAYSEVRRLSPYRTILVTCSVWEVK